MISVLKVSSAIFKTWVADTQRTMSSIRVLKTLVVGKVDQHPMSCAS